VKWHQTATHRNYQTKQRNCIRHWCNMPTNETRTLLLPWTRRVTLNIAKWTFCHVEHDLSLPLWPHRTLPRDCASSYYRPTFDVMHKTNHNTMNWGSNWIW